MEMKVKLRLSSHNYRLMEFMILRVSAQQQIIIHQKVMAIKELELKM